MSALLPLEIIQNWSNTKNSLDFAYSVHDYPRSLTDKPNRLVLAALDATQYLENFQNEWGDKAVPVIKKIKARMYHLECHIPQERRQEVQDAIHRINALIKHIEGVSSFNASEYTPPLPTDLMNIVGQYLGALSIRDQAILSSKGIMKINEASQEKIEFICAAFYSCSDESIAKAILELFLHVSKSFNCIHFFKKTPESQMLVKKFFETDAPKVRWNGLVLSKNLPSSALIKFTEASSIVKEDGFDPKNIQVLMELPNITCFTNNDRHNKLKERQYKIIVRNRNLRTLEIISAIKLNEKAFLSAYNTNLLAIYLADCPQLDIGILPQLAKSFPCLRVLHLALNAPKKQLQHFDALEKFPSLEHISIHSKSAHVKNLAVKISTLTMPKLKHLAIYPWDNSKIPTFDEEHFPKLEALFFGMILHKFLEEYDKAKLALKTPEAIESKEDEDSKEDIKNT